MVSFPPCKINLGLRILRKRADGYHDLDTCFFPLPFTDILEVIPSSELEFSSSGNVIPGKREDNLCLKAYTLLSNDVAIPTVKIHLHKIIPTGAGLGGGSADAAHTLRLLNSVFELGLQETKLHDYAAKLGSDCSFFVYDKPMIGRGRGEILTPVAVDLKGKFLVLLNPGVHVSTAQAYAGVSPAVPDSTVEEILKRPLHDWKDYLINDFESSVFDRFPVISDMKDELYRLGAAYASMSGSGSSVFGIFEKQPSLERSKALAHIIWEGVIG
jgi:4-diphosphocytidyl-2-C-methyl-D-erythritol kinase